GAWDGRVGVGPAAVAAAPAAGGAVGAAGGVAVDHLDAVPDEGLADRLDRLGLAAAVLEPDDDGGTGPDDDGGAHDSPAAALGLAVRDLRARHVCIIAYMLAVRKRKCRQSENSRQRHAPAGVP